MMTENTYNQEMPIGVGPDFMPDEHKIPCPICRLNRTIRLRPNAKTLSLNLMTFWSWESEDFKTEIWACGLCGRIWTTSTQEK